MSKQRDKVNPRSRAVCRLAASASSDEAQHNEEDIDNVEVQLERSKDVFLWTELVAAFLAADDHLSVKDQELQQQKCLMTEQEDTA